MGEEAEKIKWSEDALQSIAGFADYITEKGYPETSKKFADRLYSFGESLVLSPDKYPICRFKTLAKRNLHCAVFERNYVFIYKVIKRVLIIYNVINVKALK